MRVHHSHVVDKEEEEVGGFLSWPERPKKGKARRKDKTANRLCRLVFHCDKIEGKAGLR